MPFTERCVGVLVHDVAPATSPPCHRLLAMLDAIAPLPVTLLVVPHFHYRERRNVAASAPNRPRSSHTTWVRGN